MSPPPRSIDAYAYPRRVQPGCQHNLGCKCDPPYWLRPSTPAELDHENRFYPGNGTAAENK